MPIRKFDGGENMVAWEMKETEVYFLKLSLISFKLENIFILEISKLWQVFSVIIQSFNNIAFM